MNVYSYIDVELTQRGWHSASQSVFYDHEDIDKILEPLNDGNIAVLDFDWNEIDIIRRGEYEKLDEL
jgi:hypothetical protein